MKITHIALAALFLLPTAHAAETADQGMAMQPATQSASATGTVKKLMPEKGRVIIAHGPVETLGWPAMTMGFKATAEQIESLEVGSSVSFDFTSRGMNASITRISRQ